METQSHLRQIHLPSVEKPQVYLLTVSQSPPAVSLEVDLSVCPSLGTEWPLRPALQPQYTGLGMQCRCPI